MASVTVKHVVKMKKSVKSEVRVPTGELLDYDSGSHAMTGIPNTRNDPDLRGAQGKSGLPQASGMSDELGYMDDGGGDYIFPNVCSDGGLHTGKEGLPPEFSLEEGLLAITEPPKVQRRVEHGSVKALVTKSSEPTHTKGKRVVSRRVSAVAM